MQADLFEEHKPKPPEDPKAGLYRQLVQLGDMLGDGLGHEPDEAWIKTEYRRVCKALGITAPRRNNNAAINTLVAKHLETARCECGGQFKQNRSGSMRVFCTACCANYRLKIIKKRKTPIAGA
ncbi:Zn-dependent oligopeptidase (plasmid) [Pseudomonas fluorescens]|nr:Zn-dependent oligopeptidase [Pseudomonas fluorescens]